MGETCALLLVPRHSTRLRSGALDPIVPAIPTPVFLPFTLALSASVGGQNTWLWWLAVNDEPQTGQIRTP